MEDDMGDAEKRLVMHRDRLSADLQDQPADSYFIPNYDHTKFQELDHGETMKWLEYMHYQAWSLEHKVVLTSGNHHVYFKVWEYPDNAPEWNDVLPADLLKDAQ